MLLSAMIGCIAAPVELLLLSAMIGCIAALVELLLLVLTPIIGWTAPPLCTLCTEFCALVNRGIE